MLFKELFKNSDLSKVQKIGFIVFVVSMSILPLYIIYSATQPEDTKSFWDLRYMFGLALSQGVAQIALAVFMIKNNLPNYVVTCFTVMVMCFQTPFGIASIFIAHS